MRFLGILMIIVSYAYAPVFSMGGGDAICQLIENDNPDGLSGLLEGLRIDDAKSVLNCYARNSTPLIMCVERGRRDCMRVMLFFGADPNFKDLYGRCALYSAAPRGGPLVKQLLDAGAIHDQHPQGDFPVHRAACDGPPDALVCLLKSGTVQVNQCSRGGFTPLDLTITDLLRNPVLQREYLVNIYWLVVAGGHCAALNKLLRSMPQAMCEAVQAEIDTALVTRRRRLLPLAGQINRVVERFPRELAILVADFVIQL